MPLSRREFVAGSAALVGLAALRGGELAAAEPPDVVDVTGADPVAMVRAALDALGGVRRFVAPGARVLVKPNGGFANPPEWATTTNPAVVVAVAKACQAAGAASVTVLEHPIGKGQRCLDRCGLTAAIATTPGVKLQLLGRDDDFEETEIPGGIACRSVALAKALRTADVLVSVPAAKHHSATHVSFGLKGAMGLIHDRGAFHGMDLHQAVADLARVVRPALTIVDATRALLTNGPDGPGEVVETGRLVAGANVVSVDAYALGLARFGRRSLAPAEVRHIALAARAGLGEADVGKLRIERAGT